MVGRYGIDQLMNALIIFYFIIILIANILYRFSKISYYAVSLMGIVLLVFAVFRVFSKNIEERRA